MAKKEKGALKRRSERHKTDWNLTPLFKHDDDPRIQSEKEEVEKKSYEFINAWRGRTDFLRDPSILKEALDQYERWKRDYGSDGNPGYYFWLRTQQDQNNPALKAKFSKIEEFSRKIENDIRFFHLRIAKISPGLQRKFLDYNGLREYRHFLERTFAESRYLLSEPEERILNLKTSTSYSNWIKMTSGFLAKEERKVRLEEGGSAVRTFAEIVSLMNTKVRNVRDSAAHAFDDIMRKHVEVAEAEINSILLNKKVDDELRKLSRPDQSRHISDDIGSDVVDSLITSVSARFDIASRYYQLKSKLMNVRRLKYHERNVEYGKVDMKYSYSFSTKLILKVLENIDGEFAGIFRNFLENGRIDINPRKGKSGGAFCAHSLISQPTYILLNHTDQLHDVLTLAHELGHGINNELIRKRQNALNFGTPTSTAEVASTFMEDFVLQEILRHSDDELRLAIMMTKLNDDVSTIFRQVACYNFETGLHCEFRQKGYLSKEEIGRLFCGHMSAYMGDFVEQSEGSENWWVYWSHIRHFFYVYSYASGLLISKSLQSSVKNNAGFILKVKDFLSAGLSDSPRNIFKRLGIDIADCEFWGKGIEEVERLLEETTSLARKLRKI